MIALWTSLSSKPLQNWGDAKVDLVEPQQHRAPSGVDPPNQPLVQHRVQDRKASRLRQNVENMRQFGALEQNVCLIEVTMLYNIDICQTLNLIVTCTN